MANLSVILGQVDHLKAALHKHREWDQKSVLDALNVEYTYDSNRIEGNTLTLRETDLVIHKGLTIGGKPLVEHLEAINNYEAVGLVRELAQRKARFDKTTLLTLHALILRGIDKDNAGIYRKVPVMISGSQHEPPQPWLIDKLMEEYFLFYEEQKSLLHPIILAAELHERLVTIHPFIDGNGRTARLVMNLALLQQGFPVAIIHGDTESRLAYYDALGKCNLNQDKDDFFQLIANTVVESLDCLLKMVEAS